MLVLEIASYIVFSIKRNEITLFIDAILNLEHVQLKLVN